VPAIFDNREAVVSDVLMSYGVDFGDVFRQSSIYVGRILKGEKSADLPVARVRDHPQDRQNAWRRPPAWRPCYRGRGDRIEKRFAAVHMSAIGRFCCESD
jgi:hypothetical protein